MKKFFSYFIAFFITVITGLISIYVLTNYIDTHNSDNYLARLRENSLFGCSTLSSSKLDLLFVGDSHSYAGWNFNLMSDLLGSHEISACMMGALYFETILSLTQKIDALASYPKKLVYGVSLWQFTERKDKKKQLIEHGKLLDLITPNHKSPGNIIPGFNIIWDDIKQMSAINTGPSKILQKQLKYHTLPIEKVSEDNVLKLMKKFSNVSQASMLALLHHIKFTVNAPEQINTFCRWIIAHKIDLYVIDIPESPYLKSQYRVSDLKKYQKLIKLFSQCSQNVVTEPPEVYGLGNRHFINRFLLKDFPYAQLTGKVSELALKKNLTPDKMYDMDHLNLIGASKFTRIALKQLKLL